MDIISLLSRGSAVAVCTMLSACVVAGASGAADTQGDGHAYGAFLAAREADARSEPQIATKYYTQALQADPGNQALRAEGFLAALQAGSPQAEVLARQVPGSALAMMLQANRAALDGNFAPAAQMVRELPAAGLDGHVQ